MIKVLIVLGVIVVTAVIGVVVDKWMGVDLSHLPFRNRLIHGVTWELIGATIAATVWFIQHRKC
jgi:hypothetical protein